MMGKKVNTSRIFFSAKISQLNSESYASFFETVINNGCVHLLLKNMLTTWSIIDDDTGNVLGIFPEESEAITARVIAISERGRWKKVSIRKTVKEVTHLSANDWWVEKCHEKETRKSSF